MVHFSLLGRYCLIDKRKYKLQASTASTHRGQNSKQINIAKYISNFLIYGAKILDKCIRSQKKKLNTLSFFAKSRYVKWHPLRQTKSKNKQHFFIPIFHDIQLCFWSGRDSSPLKVFKIYFVLV